MLSNKKEPLVAEILNTKPARIATGADKACLRILRSSLIAENSCYRKLQTGNKVPIFPFSLIVL